LKWLFDPARPLLFPDELYKLLDGLGCKQSIAGIVMIRQRFGIEGLVDFIVALPAQVQSTRLHLLPAEALAVSPLSVQLARNQVVKRKLAIPATQLAGRALPCLRSG
jgi:hypothetical protein